MAATRDQALRWYPLAWRDRYGDEMVTFLDDCYGNDPLPLSARWSLMFGGIRERARHSGLVGDTVPPVERVRAGILMVLAAWVAFMIAGASLAKFSEHFDSALSGGGRRVPDVAYTILRVVSAIAGIAVILGILLAAPSFVRFARTGGWPSIRPHVLRASAGTLAAIAATVPLVVVAHHLSLQERNGASTWYDAGFVAWVGLVTLALVLWTVVTIATARRLTVTSAVLQAQAFFAVSVTIAMVVMLAATAVWWGAMANAAPGFLSQGSGPASGSPWNAWLAGTVALMVAAVVVGTAGIRRVAHGRATLRTRYSGR